MGIVFLTVVVSYVMGLRDVRRRDGVYRQGNKRTSNLPLLFHLGEWLGVLVLPLKQWSATCLE